MFEFLRTNIICHRLKQLIGFFIVILPYVIMDKVCTVAMVDNIYGIFLAIITMMWSMAWITLLVVHPFFKRKIKDN